MESESSFAKHSLILASVALWYIGYNSITSKYSVYATNILGFDFNLTLIIAQAAAIVTYVPVGIISSKIGRKKSILAGVVIFFIPTIVGFAFSLADGFDQEGDYSVCRDCITSSSGC